MKKALFCVLFAVSAFAGQITSISPSAIVVDSGEYFLTISGTNLSGQFGAQVTYNGPAGTFNVAASSATATEVVAFVPGEVIHVVGQYAVTVSAFDQPETPGSNVSGPATLTIATEVTAMPPDITVPASEVIAEATNIGGANVTFSATSMTGTVTCDHPSGSPFPLGSTTVVCTATNMNGSSSASFVVTVVDTTAPVLTLPNALVVPITSGSGTFVSYNASAFDLVDHEIAPVCTPASGSFFLVGKTTVQCTATDQHDNVARGSFDVTVSTGPVDTTKPVIRSVTASPSVLNPPTHAFVVVTVTVDATDDSGGPLTSQIVSVTSNQPATPTGDFAITGPLTVRLLSERDPLLGDRIYTIVTATQDPSGNTSIGSVRVIVTAPVKRRAVAH